MDSSLTTTILLSIFVQKVGALPPTFYQPPALQLQIQPLLDSGSAWLRRFIEHDNSYAFLSTARAIATR